MSTYNKDKDDSVDETVIKGLVEIYHNIHFTMKDFMVVLVSSSLMTLMVFFTVKYEALMMGWGMVVVMGMVLIFRSELHSKIMSPERFAKMVISDESDEASSHRTAMISAVITSTKAGLFVPTVLLVFGFIQTFFWLDGGMTNVGAIWLTIHFGSFMISYTSVTKMREYIIHVEG